MRNTPVTMINAPDTGNQTGAAVFCGQYVSSCFTVVCGDATAAGTVKVQGSNEIPVSDPGKYIPSAASWVDITGATTTIAAGVAPAIVLQTMSFQYARCVFTHIGGGTTTILVNMSALGV